VSKIIESLRASMAALYESGAIDKVTMREFDAIWPPPVREFSAKDARHSFLSRCSGVGGQSNYSDPQ
jgi:putative transcriptional regulator